MGPRHLAGEPFCDMAKLLIVHMLSWPSLEVLQALVLIAWAEFGSGRDSGSCHPFHLTEHSSQLDVQGCGCTVGWRLAWLWTLALVSRPLCNWRRAMRREKRFD